MEKMEFGQDREKLKEGEKRQRKGTEKVEEKAKRREKVEKRKRKGREQIGSLEITV
jgi:hypothetical protein